MPSRRVMKAAAVAVAVATALPGADAFMGTPASLRLRAPIATVARAEAPRGGIRGAVAIDNGEVRKHMAAALASVLIAGVGGAHPAFAAVTPPVATPAATTQAAPATTPATAMVTTPATTPAAATDAAVKEGGVQNWRYSEFMTAVEGDKVEKVTFSADGKRILAVDNDGNRYKLDAVPNDPDMLNVLTKHKVDVTVLPAQQAAQGGDLIRSLIFPAILFGGLFLLSRRGGEGGGMPGMGPGGPMDLGKSQAKIQMNPDTGVTFNDVVGVDGAKIELEEVVQFLKESERFTELGARIPRGLILEGPPGTGKTLLARAVAGEAGVPFFSVSGSEFVEMFVGVGASRVRDLFAQAKKNAPCIIFIDEIDAVGRQRGTGIAGGNDEREQTLNQILTEMDGFEGNPGIITIAATNRADVLDPALLRPGRFDRRITVDLPDFRGRVAILGVHSRGKPLEDDVDLQSKTTIGNEEISDALDRITLGPEKKGGANSVSLKMKELVAYHEAGHAVVGALIPDYDQVAKISIVPRGGAGGLTFFAPNEDRIDSGLYSRQFLESQMAVALGGRVAEEIIFGEDQVTTGASNDLERVASTAKMMVTRFGMSERIGQVALAGGDGQPNMGRQMAQGAPSMSAETKALIDSEVSRLVSGAYDRAKTLLTENRPALDGLAKMLVEKETVTAEEFAQLLSDTDVKISDYALYPQ